METCTHEGCEKIMANVRLTDTGCWEWTGFVQPNGYGQVRLGRKKMLAHRAAYEAIRGPIPNGLTLDHLCRNRACVNPSHLEPVTRGENTLRGEGITAQNARKTHCPKGHAYDAGNTRVRGGKRHCLICHRINQANYLARKRGEVNVG